MNALSKFFWLGGALLIALGFWTLRKNASPSPLVGDALFVESYLRSTYFQIYAETPPEQEKFEDVARSWVRFPEVFGGFCSAVNGNICTPLNMAGARKHPRAGLTPLREAYRAQACQALFNNPGAPRPEISAACQTTNAVCEKKLAGIFYPKGSGPQLRWPSSEKSNFEKRIAAVGMALCLTPDWQTL